MSAVAGLVLAAGEGRRLGRSKALLELDGERLVDRAVRVLREGGCAAVYVVAGAAPLSVADARVVENPVWVSGMGSSLRRGLAAVTEPAAVLMVVDTPGVGTAVVRRLLSAYRDGATVAAASYDGVLHNPVLIHRRHWDDVSALAVGDVGARAFLRAHPELVTVVECADIADPADIDTSDDWSAVVARFAR